MFNTIGKRIAFSFGLVALALALSGILASYQSAKLAKVTSHIREIRVPTVEASLTILNGVNLTQSVLKSYILISEERFRKERAEIWRQEIEPSLATLIEISPRWEHASDRQSLADVRRKLGEFNELQESIENTGASQRRKVIADLDERLVPLTSSIRKDLRDLLESKEVSMSEDLSYQATLIQQLNLLEALLVISGLLASLLMGFYLYRSIIGPISATITVADGISNGNYETPVVIEGTQEVSRLASALERMRKSLHRSHWMAQGQISLSEKLRAAGSLRELADNTASAIAGIIGAEVAAVQIVEDSKLKTVGGFALPAERSYGSSIAVGEGLAGQAAREGELVSVSGLSENSMKLSTLVGDFVPSAVVASPLVYQEQVVGVVELAASKSLEEKHIEFLNIASDIVAIALNSTQRGEQVKNLLHETQAQAEELQSQQEELKTANEELQTRQEELEASNEELEEQKSMLENQKLTLDQKNLQLNKAQDALSARADELSRISQYKSEFLANMSHELRTPLNSQLILSQMLADNKEGNLTEKQKEFSQMIHSAGLELLQLINDILDLSKVEAGKLDLEIRNFPIKDVVEDCEKAFRQSIEKKGLTFKIDVSPSLPREVRSDSQRLAQILKNFLSNAVKFTSKGEVCLQVGRPTAGELALAKTRDSDDIAFRVIDTGIGIPTDKLEKVFQAFEQVDSSVSRQYGGTGLGLAICKKLGDLLGAEVVVSSEHGMGSVFTLLVPEALASSISETSESTIVAEAITAMSASAEANAAKTLVIIDDSDALATALMELATSRGFQCHVASTGNQGLEYVQKFKPTGVLLDSRLPDISGLTVLKQIKTDANTAHIPVYMMSGDHSGAEAEKQGALGFLVKPAASKDILQALDKLQFAAIRKAGRVLVVDDEQIQLENMIQLLTSEKVSVTGAKSAAEALQILESKGPFDCMVLDLHLPDMSGFDLLEKLDQQKQMLPTIIHTAKDLSKAEEGKIRKHSESIVIKGPLSGQRLLDEVGVFLRKRDTVTATKSLQQPGVFRPETAFAGKHVLIVDDDVRNVFALSNALQAKGLTISYAHNGQEALEKLDSTTVDLVLMDVMMPVMDGFEATKRIRKRPKGGNVPVIALTAKAMKGDREACIAAGANDYLSKPVNIERLLALLRVWLVK